MSFFNAGVCDACQCHLTLDNHEHKVIGHNKKCKIGGNIG
jgi:hypothetical protein